MRLHARHGWGYRADFWAPLAALLGRLRTDDRGYYGPPRADPVEDGTPHLLIGHSFGAMRMMAQAGPGCRGLVAINGFDRFVAGDGEPGVAPRVLDRMERRCAEDPDATAVAFRARCGDFSPPPGPATPRLGADLRRLRGRAPMPPDLPLLRVDGGADPLLTPDHRAICFGGRAAVEIGGGGHLLPLSHPRRCAEAIAAFAGELA